jgi:hypothetical protein
MAPVPTAGRLWSLFLEVVVLLVQDLRSSFGGSVWSAGEYVDHVGSTDCRHRMHNRLTLKVS